MSTGDSSQIFVVDDEYSIASTLTTILRMNGFSARYFTNPIQALAAAGLGRPDLLISDVAMPEMSGVDLAIAMSLEYPAMKILLFSGQANTEDLLAAARKRGHEFQLLPKPLHPAFLLSSVRALFAPTSIECDQNA